MRSHTTRRFRKAVRSLPSEARQQARKAYRLFQENPHHPGLHFKQIHTTKPIYSVRIGLDYRALGVREGDTMIWFWIGPHADYDKLVSQLQ